ncbi:major facilitator superfamily domain-containing protein [Aspergillus tetrazonus]
MSAPEKGNKDSVADDNVTSHHDEDAAVFDEKPVFRPEADYSGAQEKTDPVEIRLVRKLDMWIMPTLWLMFWLNYLDRNAIALARLNDLEEDLNLSSSEYQTCVSILFVGYILRQIPSNMILTRVRPSWYMAGFMALWAAVSALTALAKDFKGLLLTRFFLGALYMLSIFYNRKEIATRISILYTGNILATAFAGLIAAGVFHGMDNVSGIKGWQWLFILQGTVTFVVAVLSVFTLPDDPRHKRWLSPDQRKLAYERIVADTVGARQQSSTMRGLKEAASDPRLWLFASMQHMHLAANGFKNFFPTAVETLGFNTTVTLVLTCPPYLVAGAGSVFWSWNSGRMNERTWHITIAKSLAIIGFVLGCATLNTAARYTAMIIFAIGTYAVNSIILGWVSSTCGQTNEKKASSLAIVNTIANISFIWTPPLNLVSMAILRWAPVHDCHVIECSV